MCQPLDDKIMSVTDLQFFVHTVAPTDSETPPARIMKTVGYMYLMQWNMLRICTQNGFHSFFCYCLFIVFGYVCM